jgi:hypothetical protein
MASPIVVPYEDPEYLETVYAALFSLLKSMSLPGDLAFATSTRLVQVPDQISVAAQPALLQVEAAIEASQKEVFGPVNWRMKALALIYFRADGSANPQVLPVTVANQFIWALAGVLGNTQPPYQKTNARRFGVSDVH